MTLQRNDPCPCGSGAKYKACCLKMDKARAHLARSSVDVGSAVSADTLPYAFWKRWSSACVRSEHGLLYELMWPEGEMRQRVGSWESFFDALSGTFLPAEPSWRLVKIKLDEMNAWLLLEQEVEKSRQHHCDLALLHLYRTVDGYRVRNILRQEQCERLSFAAFGMDTVEDAVNARIASGWQRPDLADRQEEEEAAGEDEKLDSEDRANEATLVSETEAL